MDEAEYDEYLVQKSIEIIKNEKRASTSVLQRRLRLGYMRAARILNILEQRGIVGPGEGAKPRQILIDLESVRSEPLQSCPECGLPVSATAMICPRCGRKLKTEQSAVGVMAAIIIGLLVAGLLIWLIGQAIR